MYGLISCSNLTSLPSFIILHFNFCILLSFPFDAAFLPFIFSFLLFSGQLLNFISMKKTILFALLSLALGIANAQQKFTKKDLAGSWHISVLQMQGRFYYNADKDSMHIEQDFIDAMGGESSDSAAEANAMSMIRLQFAALKSNTLTFNTDGSYTVKKGAETDTGTYTFDEATQAVTRTSKKTGASKTMFIENGYMKADTGGEAITVLFKKGK
jgi:hypothetical protein